MSLRLFTQITVERRYGRVLGELIVTLIARYHQQSILHPKFVMIEIRVN